MIAVAVLAAYSLFSQASAIGADERCTIVGEILGHNEENVRGALATKSCVLNNGDRDGKVVVEVDLIQATKGKGARRVVFLGKNEQCGGYLVPVVLREMKGLSGIIGAVVIKLRVLDRNKIEFNAFLRSFDPKDPEERKGTIGAACGAARSGVLERKNGKWASIAEPANLNGLEYE